MGDEFEHHLVGWDKVCTPKEKGGLGVRNLVFFFKAVLGKWLWRIGLEENNLWLRSLEWNWVDGTLKMSLGVHGCGLWKVSCQGGKFIHSMLSLWSNWGVGFGFGRISGVGTSL